MLYLNFGKVTEDGRIPSCSLAAVAALSLDWDNEAQFRPDSRYQSLGFATVGYGSAAQVLSDFVHISITLKKLSDLFK